MLTRRIYFFSLFGAAGGLAGSLLHQITVMPALAGNLLQSERYLLLALLGVLVGVSIGFFPRFAEGFGRYSFWKAVRQGLIGAFLGGLGGLCTLPLAEFLHSRLHGGLYGRALAWALLGLAIGFAEGLNSGARKWRGLVGGLMGGLVAGALVEALVARPGTHSDGGIVALLAVGLSISLGVALFVHVLSDSWLEGLEGPKVKGQVYQLGKFRSGQEALLGSFGNHKDLLVYVAGAEPRHAAISFDGSSAVLRNFSMTAPVRVEGSPITEHVLRDGQTIEIAGSRLRYRERRRALRMRVPASAALVLACLSLGSTPPPETERPPYQVRITQRDTSSFPRIRVFVSATDRSDQPISDDHQVTLTLLFAGKPVDSDQISAGWKVSVVLAIDRSSSMEEEIGEAREAAKAYVKQAPASYEMAVVAFANQPDLIQDFTRDKQLLSSRIDTITSFGETALQDTVGYALDRLAVRSGRKSLVLLTDGLELHSTKYQGPSGQSQLQQRSFDEEVTISIIGLGDEVDTSYLEALVGKHGYYLPAHQASELQKTFLQQAKLLGTEYILEFESSIPADGLKRNLDVELNVDGLRFRTSGPVTPPGILPHVPGDHRPYIAVVVFLLLTPSLLGVLSTLSKVAQFRRKNLQRLRPGSPHVGTTEVNSGDQLEPGDLVVLCPYSRTPHYARSWRLNRCKCMREPGCAGTLCYQQVLPRWLRRGLDRLSSGGTSEMGRRWLCHCRGDQEGY